MNFLVKWPLILITKRCCVHSRQEQTPVAHQVIGGHTRGAIPILLGLLLENPGRHRQRSHKAIFLCQYSVIQFCRDFCSLQMSGTITVWGITMGFTYFCLFFLSKAHDKLDWRRIVQHRPMSKRGSKLHEICCLIPGPLDHLSWERLSLPVTNGLWFTALKQR